MSCDVLLVEDDAGFREAMTGTLDNLGFTVRTAEHGLQALGLMRELQPKVVLLDLMMPVMNGWRFLENLTNNPALRDTPVVVMTASTSPRPMGCCRMLRKPMSAGELESALRPLVDGKQTVQ